MGILGNAELCLDNLDSQHPAHDQLDDIRSAARRAGELCRQLQSYVVRGAFRLQELSLPRLINELSGMIEVALSHRPGLRLQLSPDTPEIRADLSQFRQLIMNLILNAVDAVGEGEGVIRITTSRFVCAWRDLDLVCGSERWEPSGSLAPGGLMEPVGTSDPRLFAMLEITDDGCGMDEATRVRIFDPFFTTKAARSGLGLTAVQEIVRRHRGAIRVRSEPGSGTSFKLIFPASESTFPVTAFGTHEKVISGSGTILFVDDEESVRRVGRKMLERLGYRVILAGSGADALARLAESVPIHGIILDMLMPGISGSETFLEIRRRHPEIGVILTSGYDRQEMTQDLVDPGFKDFIQKPFSMQELGEKTHKLVGGDPAAP